MRTKWANLRGGSTVPEKGEHTARARSVPDRVLRHGREQLDVTGVGIKLHYSQVTHTFFWAKIPQGTVTDERPIRRARSKPTLSFRGRRRSCGAERRRANPATQSSVVCAMRGTKNPWQCPLMPANGPAERRIPSAGATRRQFLELVDGRRSGGTTLRRQDHLWSRAHLRG